MALGDNTYEALHRGIALLRNAMKSAGLDGKVTITVTHGELMSIKRDIPPDIGFTIYRGNHDLEILGARIKPEER